MMRTTLQLRQFYGFGLIITLLICIVGLNIYFLDKINQANLELRIHNQHIKYATAIESASVQIVNIVDKILLSKEAGKDITPLLGKYSAAMSLLTNNEKRLAFLLEEGRGELREAWLDVRQNMRDFVTINDGIVALIKKGKLEEAMKLKGRIAYKTEENFMIATELLLEEHSQLPLAEFDKVEHFNKSLRGDLLILAVIAIILAIVISYYISRSISTPILKLRDVAGEISKGKLDVRAEITSKDEIGDLANSFNKMVVDLKRLSESERKRAEELEAKVSERTKELEKARGELAQKVKDRTKELEGAKVQLEDRVSELDRSQTAMLYMVEDLNRQTTEIKESQKRVKIIVDSIDTGVLIIDAQSRKIVEGNPAAAKMIGLPLEKIVGRVCHKFVCPTEVNKCPVLDLGQKVDHSEKVLINAKGEKIPVIKTAFPVTLDGRKHILDSFVDITKLKEAESQLKDAQEKVVKSEKLAAIGQLAASVAHEIRNPLGAMKNVLYYFNMLDLGKTDADIKENLDIMNQEIVHVDHIITDLLEFARVKKPTLREENINQIIKETLNRIKTVPNIEITTELDDKAPNIEADALQVQQVFYNMVQNAMQAMEKGGRIKIETKLAGDFLEASFADTGPGIAKENLAKIFDPFFSTKAKGTGLGLSVCKSLIEGHKGMIDVESEVGKGTTFKIKFPTKRG